MALHFQTNMLAYRASVNLNKNYSRLSKSVDRLSTGLRLSSAEDGPSDMALRNMLRADAATLDKSLRNTEDGISIINMADKSMQAISEKIIQMKTLAEQGATTNYTAAQRLTINSEFHLMATEIDRIARTTNFSTIGLIDGSVSTGNMLNPNGGWFQANSSRHHDTHSHFTEDLKMKIHMGTGNRRIDDYYYVSMKNMTTEYLFGDSIPEGETDMSKYITLSAQHNSQKALLQIDKAIARASQFRGELGAIQNTMLSAYDAINAQKYEMEYAESRISDVDVAEEMTDFVANQVMAQSATAILSQANTLPEIFLRLMA